MSSGTTTDTPGSERTRDDRDASVASREKIRVVGSTLRTQRVGCEQFPKRF
jgi:hypothetical protein